MEGFLEISSSIYLFSSRKNYEDFAYENCRKSCFDLDNFCNIFLIEGASRTHPTKEILPETNLQFSFLFCNVFLKRGSFNTPYKMEINPSIETALLFSFSDLFLKFEFSEFILFEKLLQQHTQMEEILPLEQSSLSLLTCNNFSSCFLESSSNTPYEGNPSGTAFPFSFSEICKEAKR